MLQTDSLEPVLEVDEIQGNILGGFNKHHQALLPIHFDSDNPSAEKFRAWLKQLLPTLTWVHEVLDYKRERRRRMAREGDEPSDMAVVWCNIAFSYSGMRKLTNQAEAFEPVFRAGLPAASGRLGDPQQVGNAGHADSWLIGGPGKIPDALVILAADDPDDLDAEVQQFLASAVAAEIRCPRYDVGHDLSHFNTDENQFRSGLEHFGFSDGVSQPGVRGRASADEFLTPRTLPDTGGPGSTQPQFSAPGQPLIAAGEFVLGYARQNESFGRRTSPPWKLGPEPFAPDAEAVAPYWAKNGSFLVYRRLRQDVPMFNRFMESEANRLSQLPEFTGMTPERLGALLVGRWRSGAPVMRTPDIDNAALGANKAAANDFGYFLAHDPDDCFPPVVSTAPGLADPAGKICPQAAHIRKVNPRDLSTEQGSPNTTLVHRILRRGIPYGPPLPVGATDDADGEDRGLLFLCYQASIREQFEFLAVNWMNDNCKPSALCPIDGSGFDMILGQNREGDRERSCVIGEANTSVSTSGFAEWVVSTGGGYFFAPSRSAIRNLWESVD